MASVSPKLVATWLQQRSSHISALLSQIRLLGQITNVIRANLPEPLSLHCRAVNIDGDTLIVACDSSIWTAKLRFQLPHLLNRLKDRSDLPGFCQIRVRVQPLAKGKMQPSNRRFFMSEQASTLITNVADNTIYPQLKAALYRLGQRAKSLNNRQ